METLFTPDSQLSDFFLDQMQEICNAEKKLCASWPSIQLSAHILALQQAFTDYYLLLQKKIMRLEGIFTLLGVTMEDRKAEAVAGLLSEVNTVIDKTTENSHTRDAAIIVAIQKIGHYKIATYGSLQQIATTLGMEDISNILSQSLQEEKNNDLLLSGIADKKINWLAEMESKS